MCKEEEEVVARRSLVNNRDRVLDANVVFSAEKKMRREGAINQSRASIQAKAVWMYRDQ